MRRALPGEGTCAKIPFIYLFEHLLRRLAFSPAGERQAGKSEPDHNTHVKEEVVQTATNAEPGLPACFYGTERMPGPEVQYREAGGCSAREFP
jgi:hypothetical protein